MSTDRHGGLLGRFRRLFSSTDELEAEELQESTEELGATRVCDCVDRSRATVAGSIRTVTQEPRGDSPALEAVLYDGSDQVTLVWLGRRKILGIEPGRRLRAEGLVTTTPDGQRAMYNPRYELIAS